MNAPDLHHDERRAARHRGSCDNHRDQVLTRALVSRLGTFHTLRHTYCTQVLSQGVSAKVVSVLAGHASSSFTMDQYAAAPPDDMEYAAEKVAHGLFRPVVAKGSKGPVACRPSSLRA
ncbi:MAG: tyrosine-type recombinase/integrase [Steroidobacteraceae bacterium]|nr:tyrosine-type recombinase/integrase [Steroidobacteraceae bacterium]MBP9129453.1 tyrosine-type recombinase/integrase [Steroidobacteraceae bacterium]